MAHEITDTDEMFSVREMPWHGLGRVLDEYPTREEAQPMVHGWEPISEPLFRAVPKIDPERGPITEFEEVGTLGNFRSDNGHYLGPISETYVTVKNDEMWDVAEAIQGGGVDVKYETGGSLRGGRDVWLLLTLDEPLVVKGDPHGATKQYYMLSNKHDGTGAFKGSATAVRVVCANTLRMADMDAQAHGTEFSFSHTKNVADRIEEAKIALAGWRESVAEWTLFSEMMIKTSVSERGIDEFLKRFIPEPVGRVVSDRVRNNIEAARGQWLECFNSVTGEGIRNTAYGLLQASSEYSEWMRKSHNEETRFRRAFWDRNQVMVHAKSLALDAALV